MKNRTTCKTCGAALSGLSWSAFCHADCRKNYNAPGTRHCELCGGVIPKQNKHARYCSHACRTRGGLITKAATLAERKRMYPESMPRASWSLASCPFAEGNIAMEGGRLPDAAWGF